MNKSIYLDYAAATPLDPSVFKAMQPYYMQKFYNPSAPYLSGKAVRDEIEAARGRIARWLGARPAEITFTASGTEANNLAIHGVMRQFPDANMVVSAVEHEAVMAPAHRYNCREAVVRPSGLVDIQQLAKSIDDKTVLVSIMYANNEIGTIQPLRQVAQVVEEERARRYNQKDGLPIYLHTDACQAGNYLNLHVHGLGVDLLTLNAGKIYGPKQTGLLYARTGIQLVPLIDGGGQENGRRSGTESPANIAGFAAALDLVQGDKQAESKRTLELQSLFFDLLKRKIPQAVINGTKKQRLPNNVHITIPGTDNERIMMELDQRGVMCAVGSACSASKEEPSHVLRAIGLSESQAQASLRFTMGRQTKESDIKKTVDMLSKLVSHA
ncbi:MAG: cysteine desulfurase family protein [Candidatus Saccharibacteria bacterium]|nr:cysteine desulfurase family protein [Candidatus Saccharibacteria bacterium]